MKWKLSKWIKSPKNTKHNEKSTLFFSKPFCTDFYKSITFYSLLNSENLSVFCPMSKMNSKDILGLDTDIYFIQLYPDLPDYQNSVK